MPPITKLISKFSISARLIDATMPLRAEAEGAIIRSGETARYAEDYQS